MPSDEENVSDTESREDSKRSKRLESSGKELKTRRRTKTGCLTCRKRRIKCGEERPTCRNCVKSKRECAGYSQPLVYKPQLQSQIQPEIIQPQMSAYEWSTAPHDDVHNELHNSYQMSSIHSSALSALSRWPQSSASQQVPSSGIIVSQVDDHPPADSLGCWSGRQTFGQSYQPIEAFPAADLDSSHFPGPSTGTQRLGDALADTIPQDIKRTTERLSSTAKPAVDHRDLAHLQASLSASINNSRSQVFASDRGPAYRNEAEDDPDDPWDVELDENNVYNEIAYGQDVLREPLSAHPTRSKVMPDIPYQFQLATVTPTFPTISPLMEAKSQQIFQHFMSVTGPCMGISNRHYHTDASAIPRTIWTHSLPAMAFKCPALAHAILAVSAIHMFRLGLGSENTAVKHFTLALKRIGKILGEHKDRLQVSTLATVLLLGYYEVMTGDHSRWNLHLSGAGKLVMEHDYARMVRAMRDMQATGVVSIAQPWIQNQTSSMGRSPQMLPNDFVQLFGTKGWKVDHILVAKFIGSEVRYDDQIQPNLESTAAVPERSQSNVDDWMLLVELYWWYCKQDVFMSMLSGDPLLLPYTQWKYCPPRGPLNNVDKPHATLDHLWLLLGRLTDFGGKDRRRKQQAINLQGGHWIPPPDFLGNVGPAQDSGRPDHTGRDDSAEFLHQTNKLVPPSANEGRTRKAKQHPMQQPPFYGMIPPPTGPVHMSSSFRIMNYELRGRGAPSPVHDKTFDQQELALQTQSALEEHASIAEAFDLFESLLDTNYDPLPSTDIQIATPFGSALQYRTSVIATMWTFFYVGRILLCRLHPHSPPAAMVSLDVNASKTHKYAQLVGRICGGLFARHTYLLQAGHVDHSLSAAVMETTFSLLFAAVQYQDPSQRGWTISKLTEIARVTGWQTAGAVAGCCETTWEKAGLAGRGPQYQRTLDQNNPDVRLSGKSNSSQQSSSSAELSPTEEHKSRFVSHDRHLIDRHASTRAHWALGLLSVEEDMQRITLNQSD